MKKNLFALCLVISLLLSSCGTTPSDAPETTPGGTASESETEKPRDSLPSDLNFGGRTVTLFIDRDMSIVEYFADETGDVVDDAVYKRNLAVQERLGVKFDFIESDGLWDGREIYQGSVRTSVLAGDGEYDIAAGYGLSIAVLAGEGLMTNLTDTKYIDFDMPWWPDSLIGALSVNGKLWMASGDISTNTIGTSFAVLFNKDLLETYKLEDPYALVDSGKWTFDKLFSMTKDIYSDLDGDGKKSAGDFFGVGMGHTYIDNAYYACGLRVVEQDKEMGQKLSADFSGEKAVAFIEKFTTAFHHTDSCLLDTDEDMIFIDFKNKQMIFLLDSLTAASTTLRDADFRYGVLPSPKWDEAQENYITTASYTGSMYAIPRDAKDPDISSAVIEALASEGYYRVAPAFFETALKVKYSSDDDSARMYDIIKGSVMYDFGRVYSMAGLDGIPGLMRSMVVNDNTNWASEVASKKTVLEEKLAALVEKLG